MLQQDLPLVWSHIHIYVACNGWDVVTCTKQNSFEKNDFTDISHLGKLSMLKDIQKRALLSQ